MSVENRDPNNPIKGYTGVWIPKEVTECEQLSAIEKWCYGEIRGFGDSCYASNAWFSKRLKISEVSASKTINKLIKLGFVKKLGFNGRFREIRAIENVQPLSVVKGRLKAGFKADLKQTLSREKSIEQSKDNTISNEIEPLAQNDKNLGKETTTKKEAYGNVEINRVFDEWKNIMGAPLKAKQVLNRRAAKRLIDAYGVENVIGALKISNKMNENRYETKVNNFMDLWDKWQNVLNFYRRAMKEQYTKNLMTPEGRAQNAKMGGIWNEKTELF